MYPPRHAVSLAFLTPVITENYFSSAMKNNYYSVVLLVHASESETSA